MQCDETTPQCQRCARRQMPCSFLESAPATPVTFNTPVTSGQHEQITTSLAPFAAQNQGGSNAPTPGSASDHVPSPISTPPQQSFSPLDLELIHYYSTQTYMTMTSKLTAHLVWRDVIFQEGLKHSFLLHALMATAALHKATHHSEDSEKHAAYVKVAFSYQNAALAGYIPALSSPNEDNAVALFTLSALLTIWLFGSKRLPEALNAVKLNSSPNFLPRIAKTSENDPRDFLEILTLVQGINAVVKQTIHWLWGSAIDPLLRPPHEAELPPVSPEVETSFQKLRGRIMGASLVKAENIGTAPGERIEIYLERLHALRRVSRARTVLEHDQQVFAWPVTSNSPYIDLVRQREPIAIALFIHWAACIRCLDHLWWAKGWAYRLVKDTSCLLDDSWADVLHWPRKEVGLE